MPTQGAFALPLASVAERSGGMVNTEPTPLNADALAASAANELLRQRIRQWAEYFWVTLGNAEVLALMDDPKAAVRQAADCADVMMDEYDKRLSAALRVVPRMTL